jgi:hypothetical protein
MSYAGALPERVPEKGFYYHCKHDPAGAFNNYAYEMLGVAEHTEEREMRFVIYRPLSEDSPAWQKGKMFYARPLSMFMEEVEKDGKRFPRFAKISDPSLIEKLEALRKEMYG